MPLRDAHIRHDRIVTAVFALVFALLAACGGDDEHVATGESPGTRPTRDEIRRFDDLTIQLMMQGPGLVGTSPTDVTFSADGERIFFNWNSPHKLDSLNALDPLAAYDHHVSLAHEAGYYALDVATRAVAKVDEPDETVPTESAWNRARNRCAEIRGGDVYLVDLPSRKTRRITDTVASELGVQVSREGDVVYFASEGNLFSVGWEGAPIRQLTQLLLEDPPSDEPPSPQRQYLIDQQKSFFKDFQREEPEEDPRRPAPVHIGAGWQVDRVLPSPSGRYAAVEISKQAAGARHPLVPHFVTQSGYMETREARPKVDDLRDANQVRLVDLQGDSIVALRIDDDMIANLHGWSPIDDILLVRGITADYKARYFYSVDARARNDQGGITPMVLDEYRDDAWVGGPGFYTTGAWLADGSGIYYWSEGRGGFSHLFTVSLDGTRHTRLTNGPWEVYDAVQSRDGAHWYLVTNEGDPGSHRLWVMNRDGQNRRLLTPDVGQYAPRLSPDGTKIALLRSTINQPPELYVLDLPNAAVDGPFTESTTELFRSFAWISPEVVTIGASDGGRFRSHVFTPEAFGKKSNGAGVIFVHGAGYLQNVMQWWSHYYREYMFNHYLALHGYTVLNIDFRASAGYGRKSRVAIHKHFGGRDLDDVIDAARYLSKERDVDAGRIGTYGGSYGGFLTIMALFKYPDVVECGAAIRSVTDWAHYNHWYTSRILGLPGDDPEAYERSSPIYFAEGFEGGLLMLHGLVDDNVLAADVLRLSQRLIELGKQDWNLMIYPMEPHAFIRASSWTDEYRRIFELFERELAGRSE